MLTTKFKSGKKQMQKKLLRVALYAIYVLSELIQKVKNFIIRTAFGKQMVAV